MKLESSPYIWLFVIQMRDQETSESIMTTWNLFFVTKPEYKNAQEVSQTHNVLKILANQKRKPWNQKFQF